MREVLLHIVANKTLPLPWGLHGALVKLDALGLLSNEIYKYDKLSARGDDSGHACIIFVSVMHLYLPL